ncbi:MAG: family 20 glycosylhydrolase [Planctomycetota bacterium]
MPTLRALFAALLAIGVATGDSAGSESAAVVWKLIGNDLPERGHCRGELVVSTLGMSVDADREACLYFNYGRMPATDSDMPDEPCYEHVNGDLYRLPLDASDAKGGVVRVAMVSQGTVLNITDAPAGFFLVCRSAGGAETVTPLNARIDLSVLENQPQDTRPDPLGELTGKSRPALGTSAPVVPQPSKYVAGSGIVQLDGLPIVSDRRHASAIRLLTEAIVGAGRPAPRHVDDLGPDRAAIRLVQQDVIVGGVTKTAGDEAYTMEADARVGVRITGTDDAGVYYGVQTLVALIANDGTGADKAVVREAVVHDAPHFCYRGLHLDVARNFHPPATVRRLLDLMATYKLNRFHLHLTDDEGWRLAIQGLPELTDVGGRRGYSPGFREYLPPSFGSGPDPSSPSASGYYSRSEFVELLRYAAARQIEVIPEIDLPGHARAAIHAMHARYQRLMEQGDSDAATQFLLRSPNDESEYRSIQGWNDNVVDVRLDSAMAFVEHVVGDVAAMYAEADLRLNTIHFGGDEVPAGCWGTAEGEELQSLFATFMRRCGEVAQANGSRAGCWEEVFLEGGPGDESLPSGLCYAWNNLWGGGREDAAYRLANAGTSVVLCAATHLYFDLAYEMHPDEPGYYWAGATDTEEVFRFRPYAYFDGAVFDSNGKPVSDAKKCRKATLTGPGRKHVVGMQGQLWGENLVSADRLDYLGFPRVLALAERAWVGPAGEVLPGLDPPRSWGEFSNHVGHRELPRLDRSFGGVGYRLPTLHVAHNGRAIEAESGFPGLVIRYTTDSSEPTSGSPRFESPLPADGEHRFRVFDTRGRGGRSVTWTPSANASR